MDVETSLMEQRSSNLQPQVSFSQRLLSELNNKMCLNINHKNAFLPTYLIVNMYYPMYYPSENIVLNINFLVYNFVNLYLFRGFDEKPFVTFW